MVELKHCVVRSRLGRSSETLRTFAESLNNSVAKALLLASLSWQPSVQIFSGCGHNIAASCLESECYSSCDGQVSI